MTDSANKKVPKAGKPRKPYRAPVFSKYGDVRRLTGGGSGAGADAGGGGPMTMMCWIAEALYGVDAPRVFLVRAWLTRCLERRDGWALFIVPLYVRFGQRMAVLVRTVPAMKRILRPVFDRAVRRAYAEYSAQAAVRRNLA